MSARSKTIAVNSWQEVPLSVDLVAASQRELDFLQAVDKAEHFYDPEFVKCAIFRYERFWLPLVAELSTKPKDDLAFAPPMDVHWVWHVHMLSPRDYAKDCRSLFF